MTNISLHGGGSACRGRSNCVSRLKPVFIKCTPRVICWAIRWAVMSRCTGIPGWAWFHDLPRLMLNAQILAHTHTLLSALRIYADHQVESKSIHQRKAHNKCAVASDHIFFTFVNTGWLNMYFFFTLNWKCLSEITHCRLYLLILQARWKQSQDQFVCFLSQFSNLWCFHHMHWPLSH